MQGRAIALIVLVLLAIARGDSRAGEPDRTLRLEQGGDGGYVFLDWQGRIVGWIPAQDAVAEGAETLHPAPPAVPGWPVLVPDIAATPTVADVDADGSMEVAFSAISLAVRRAYLYGADGTMEPGWPPPHEIRTAASSSLADVNGDGTLEIFIGALNGTYGFYHDGSQVPGWPQDGDVGFDTVGIEDLDGDGSWELVTGDEGDAFVWDRLGRSRPGWPFPFPQSFHRPFNGPAIGDTDGDGRMEIAHAIQNIPSLYLFNGQGAVSPGFPLDLEFGLGEGVSMADVDGDGTQELWIQSGVGAQILDHNGTPRPGFPVRLSRGNRAPAVGDLDGDGRLEMVWATPGGDAKVNVVRDDGTVMPGWPVVVPRFSFNSQATLGDIDGDGGIDIILGGFEATFAAQGRVYAWHADGTPVSGFPFAVPDGKAILSSSVTITDLDQDGDVDLVVGALTESVISTDGRVFAFDLDAPFDRTTLEWPTRNHNIRHTARYEPPPRLAAHAGFDRVLECGSPAGAVVTLNGSQSADKDSSPGTNDDIVSFEWFTGLGSPDQQLLGDGEFLEVTLGLGEHLIALRVTDSTGNQDSDRVRVRVVDTMPPAVRSTPPLLWPPNHRMVDVDVTVVDACGPATFAFLSIENSEPDDAPGLGDGRTTGDVEVLGEVTFALRAERDGTGPGRTYSLLYETADAAGNAAVQTLQIPVPHDQGGTTEPLLLSLSETEAGTVVVWQVVPGAVSYDVVRGGLASLRDLGGSHRLGPLACIGAGLTEAGTASLEDAAAPAVGEGFFYLAGYDDGQSSGYGTESAAKDRFVPAGHGCP